MLAFGFSYLTHYCDGTPPTPPVLVAIEFWGPGPADFSSPAPKA